MATRSSIDLVADVLLRRRYGQAVESLRPTVRASALADETETAHLVIAALQRAGWGPPVESDETSDSEAR